MLKKIFIGLFLFFFFLGAGLYYFKEEILTYSGKKLVVSDTLKKVDLIVALGGENLRKKEAVRLFMDGYGRKILFTGFEIEKEDYTRYGLKEKDFIYPVRFIENTYEEAVFTLDVAKKNRYKSVIVVTSFFHTRRAAYVFKKILGREGIEVMIYPVYNKAFNAGRWWENAYLRKVVIMEWLGMAYYKMEYR